MTTRTNSATVTPRRASIDYDDDSSYGTGESFGNGHESFADDHNGDDDKSSSNEQAIAKNESRAVQVVRALVLFMLLGVTGGVGYGVYHYVSSGEENDFNEDFEDSSEKVLESVGDYLDQTLGAVDNFVVGIVTNAEQSSDPANPNTTWPYARIPDFAVRGAKLLSLSKASVFGVYPRVTKAQRKQWEAWAVENDDWVADTLQVQRNDPTYTGRNVDSWYPGTSISNNYGPMPENATGPHFPTYYQSPLVPVFAAYNWDLYNDYKNEIDEATSRGVVTMGRTLNIVPDDYTVNWIEGLIGPDLNPREPLLAFYYPIDANSNKQVKILSGDSDQGADHKFVGVVAVTIFWRQLLRNILSPGSDGTIAVIGSDCNQTFTYEINGDSAFYVGAGDLHDPEYDSKERFAYLHELNSYDSFDRRYTGFPLSKTYCPYWIKLYPSDDMKSAHESNNPIIFMVVAISIFVFTSMVFILYDCVSERRQRKVLHVAKQSTKIVAGLFPQVVRDRLFKTQEQDAKPEKAGMVNAKLRLTQFLRGDEGEVGGSKEATKGSSNAPIAELFSETTVLFADIAGFTAWSSLREPAQVFSLLEALYGAFDRIAHARGVFKVETIGDSYVAVAGLPDPRPDHALVMCKFARDIREKMVEVTKELGNELGPDTAELGIRIGLNSGPVTAGVLRGDRSRFQLFGDTVNTASRMESTGVVSKIQVSESTASLLTTHHKEHWLSQREGGVVAKGKGKIQTYFVEPRLRGGSSSNDSDDYNIAQSNLEESEEKKTARLVDWNCAVLTKILKQIAACRDAALNGSSAHSGRLNGSSAHSGRLNGSSVHSGRAGRSNNKTKEVPVLLRKEEGMITLDEVKEVIDLAEFNARQASNLKDPSSIELNSKVTDQLNDYVARIARSYRGNSFHCFEHASHVTMSVVKLLSRIVAPSDAAIQNAKEDKTDMASTLHDHTYGITSDPLIQFSCVFAALIHDVDHQGVPNAQLVVENSPLVGAYNGKAMAEQNSVDIAWNLLMEQEFVDLRNAICATSEEMARFRQLVVNSVIATDIMDKDLKAARNARWDKAFSEGRILGESEHVNTNRRATIVIEHLLQASDVAHTMQHWHVFCKWNEQLFNEMHHAYKLGRADKDPADFWYQGEMDFFDYYIIPLARKLSDCGVFGVSSDECLSYALKNREEWEDRGQEVVARMVQKIHVAEEAERARALKLEAGPLAENSSRDVTAAVTASHDSSTTTDLNSSTSSNDLEGQH